MIFHRATWTLSLQAIDKRWGEVMAMIPTTEWRETSAALLAAAKASLANCRKNGCCSNEEPMLGEYCSNECAALAEAVEAAEASCKG